MTTPNRELPRSAQRSARSPQHQNPTKAGLAVPNPNLGPGHQTQGHTPMPAKPTPVKLAVTRRCRNLPADIKLPPYALENACRSTMTPGMP